MEDEADEVMGGFGFFEVASTSLSARFLFPAAFPCDRRASFFFLGLAGLGRSLSANESESVALVSSNPVVCGAPSGYNV